MTKLTISEDITCASCLSNDIFLVSQLKFNVMADLLGFVMALYSNQDKMLWTARGLHPLSTSQSNRWHINLEDSLFRIINFYF